jgi:tRNA U55 pseudouridine synthase TruB
VLGPQEALSFLPQVELDEAQARAISYGQKIAAESVELPAAVQADPSGSFRLVCADNLIAVARLADPYLRPEVVLEPAS